MTMVILLGMVLSSAGSRAWAQSIVGSKHDLSTSARPEVCVFCHTPHNANTGLDAPLWNRALAPGVTFTPYTSPTLDAQCPATPSGVSLACLSCHDGAIANPGRHKLVNPPGSLSPDEPYGGSCSRCHVRGTTGMQLTPGLVVPGTDMRNDHPISMRFPAVGLDGSLAQPPDSISGWPDVKLYDGKVECPTCHNVHNPTIRPFLRKTTADDLLCKTCHLK